VNKPLKTPPPYAIASVDHALRAAAMLQLEDGLTVSQVAERQETANLAIRTGDTVRFIASAECRQALRVGSREGV